MISKNILLAIKEKKNKKLKFNYKTRGMMAEIEPLIIRNRFGKEFSTIRFCKAMRLSGLLRVVNKMLHVMELLEYMPFQSFSNKYMVQNSKLGIRYILHPRFSYNIVIECPPAIVALC